MNSGKTIFSQLMDWYCQLKQNSSSLWAESAETETRNQWLRGGRGLRKPRRQA